MAVAYIISCHRGVPPAIFWGPGLHLEDIGAQERTTKDVNAGTSRVGRQTLSFDCGMHLTFCFAFLKVPGRILDRRLARDCRAMDHVLEQRSG